MTKQIKKIELNNWLAENAGERRVIAPQRSGEDVLFGLFDSSKEVVLDELPLVSAKTVFLPPAETLFTFKHIKTDISKEQLSLTPTYATADTLLFGVMPSDLHGFAILDYAFSNHYKDPYYLKRREKTLVVSCLWHVEHEACFCDVFPPSLVDADIAMLDGGDIFYLRAVTDKGKEFLASGNLEDAGKKGEEIQGECSLKAETSKLDIKGIEDKIDAVFESELWLELTEQCLGCGICTYVCPTCYCFDMFDEGCGGSCGKRMRTWDTCQDPKFTLEASGHNPRQRQFQRYRNRIYHKFKALKDKTGSYGCTGCGRCVKYCPVGIDIREIVKRVCSE